METQNRPYKPVGIRKLDAIRGLIVDSNDKVKVSEDEDRIEVEFRYQGLNAWSEMVVAIVVEQHVRTLNWEAKISMSSCLPTRGFGPNMLAYQRALDFVQSLQAMGIIEDY